MEPYFLCQFCLVRYLKIARGACVAQRYRNGLPRDGPGFDSRWERCIYRAPCPLQGTVNGGAVSKWPRCWRGLRNKQTNKHKEISLFFCISSFISVYCFSRSASRVCTSGAAPWWVLLSSLAREKMVLVTLSSQPSRRAILCDNFILFNTSSSWKIHTRILQWNT